MVLEAFCPPSSCHRPSLRILLRATIGCQHFDSVARDEQAMSKVVKSSTAARSASQRVSVESVC